MLKTFYEPKIFYFLLTFLNTYINNYLTRKNPNKSILVK